MQSNLMLNMGHELHQIGQMIRNVYSLFLNFANRLCSLEKRILNYQIQEGYRWVDTHSRKNVVSDFYGYIKINQRHITLDLKELNDEFSLCKKQAQDIIEKFKEEKPVLAEVKAPLITYDNIINFPKVDKPEVDVIQDLSNLLCESEKLSKDLLEKHKKVSTQAENLVIQMRGQLKG